MTTNLAGHSSSRALSITAATGWSIPGRVVGTHLPPHPAGFFGPEDAKSLGFQLVIAKRNFGVTFFWEG